MYCAPTPTRRSAHPKTSRRGIDPTCSPRRSLGVPARPPPVDTKKLPPWGVAFCGKSDDQKLEVIKAIARTLTIGGLRMQTNSRRAIGTWRVLVTRARVPESRGGG